MPTNSDSKDRPFAKSQESDSTDPERLTVRISTDSFESWYRQREFRQNIQNGTPYFNGPSTIKGPRRHSPSSLCQCHRKVAYKQLNSPEENEDPQGIFWFGTQFEEEIILPYLQEAVVGPYTYACNTLWVDFDVKTESGRVRIKGATDPVIVDRESEPVLLTEIKTKASVSHLDSPNLHHKAQAYAYMYGLSQKYDRQVTDAVIIYGSRKNLNIKSFHIEFDPWFWRETVVDWAEEHTQYRIDEVLPPADPEFDWECEFCSYQNRCGESESEYRNTGPVGLLPLFPDYPKEKVRACLESHEESKLTPTLGHRYPELAEEYGVFDWRCSCCGESHHWEEVSCSHDPFEPPLCPSCLENGERVTMSGPAPTEQYDINGGEDRV